MEVITMKFTKYIRFEQPYWFCGIYKIVRYTWYKGSRCKPYYHAYRIIGSQWGDYVGGKSAQENKQLSFKQVVKLCEEHANDYTPTKAELKKAEDGRLGWLSIDPENKAA
jgi:hypothetical protein